MSSTHLNITIKLTKDNNKRIILKTTREKYVIMYKGSSVNERMASQENEWRSDNREMMYLTLPQEIGFQQIIPHSAKLYFKN